jgi:hypothetical protein
MVDFQKQQKIPEIGTPVNGAAVLKYSPAQGAVNQEHFRNRYVPGIKQILNIVSENPIPGTILKRFLQ